MDTTKKKSRRPIVPESSYLRTYQHLDEDDKEEMDRILSSSNDEQVSDKLEFKPFIGCKVVRAAPMDEQCFLKNIKGKDIDPNQETRPGYVVIYPDNYVSWSPQFTFDNTYRLVNLKEAELIIDSISKIAPTINPLEDRFVLSCEDK